MRTKFTVALVALVIVAASSLGIQSAIAQAKKGDSGSYSAGYAHGCDDSNYHQMIGT
jgi:hypothetical protein